MGGYDARVERLAVSSRLAKLAKSHRCMTCGRLYSCDTILKRLAPHLQDVAAELWSCIQQEHPIVRPRDFARPWPLAAPDPPHIGDRVRRGPKRARGGDGAA